MPDKNGIPTEKEIYDALMPKADDPRIQKKPVKVIKKGDMSPETKALPDEVVKPPKGIGSSENDMGPLPKSKGLNFATDEEIEKERVKAVMESVKPGSPLMLDAKRRYEESLKQPPREYKKKGGMIKKMASGGSVKSSASKRADGIAVKGKTRGKIC